MSQPRRNRYRIREEDSVYDLWRADWRPRWWPFWCNIVRRSSRSYCEELCVEHARKAMTPGGVDAFDPYQRILDDDLLLSKAAMDIALLQEQQTRRPHLETLLRKQEEERDSITRPSDLRP
jgi:hypothetical protein